MAKIWAKIWAKILSQIWDKNYLGKILGKISLDLGDFFSKTSGHPGYKANCNINLPHYQGNSGIQFLVL